MKKQVITIFVLILLLNSLFAVAETTSASSSSSDTSLSCNWWCKVKAVFSGNVVEKEKW